MAEYSYDQKLPPQFTPPPVKKKIPIYAHDNNGGAPAPAPAATHTDIAEIDFSQPGPVLRENLERHYMPEGARKKGMEMAAASGEPAPQPQQSRVWSPY